MIVAGVEVGNETAKAVVLNDGIISFSIIPVEQDWKIEATRILQKALEEAGLSFDKVKNVVSTGLIEDGWEQASEYISEVTCIIRGSLFLFPSVRTVIDMGAEGSFVAKCEDDGILIDYTANQKCASGTGIFLELISNALEVDLKDIGKLSLESTKEIEVTSTCAVFAESEVVSLIYKGIDKRDILNGIHRSIAARTLSMIQTVGGVREDVVLTGGIAHNIGIVKSLEKQLGVNILVPHNPEIVGPLGAALIAKENV